jgi:hypothetical protein
MNSRATTIVLLILPFSLCAEQFSSKHFYVLPNSSEPPPLESIIQLGYSLKKDGSLSIKSNAHAPKILIQQGSSQPTNWALISFHNNLLESIIKIQKVYPGLDEIQLDLEQFTAKDSSKFTDLLCSVQKSLKPQGLKLAIAAFPPNHPDNTRIHNWSMFPKCVDKIYVMMYDLHNPRTGPGQVTTSPWIESNLNTIQKLAGNKIFSKLILGLPLYGYSWNKNNQFLKAYPMRRIKAVEEAGLDGLIWKRSDNETIYIQSNKFIAYWEEEATKRGLAGVVYWRWGYGYGL